MINYFIKTLRSDYFNYFTMSENGWWSAGAFENGKRYGLDYEGVSKMSRGEYWNQDGSPQYISVSRTKDGMELWLNGNPIYSVGNSIDFKQKKMGVISLGNTSVYFKKFTASYLKK